MSLVYTGDRIEHGIHEAENSLEPPGRLCRLREGRGRCSSRQLGSARPGGQTARRGPLRRGGSSRHQTPQLQLHPAGGDATGGGAPVPSASTPPHLLPPPTSLGRGKALDPCLPLKSYPISPHPLHTHIPPPLPVPHHFLLFLLHLEMIPLNPLTIPPIPFALKILAPQQHSDINSS